MKTIIFSVLVLIIGEVHSSEKVLYRKADLIVKAKISYISQDAKVIPAKAWYDYLKEEQRLVLGFVRLNVSEVIKGKVGEDKNVIFAYPLYGFYEQKDKRKVFRMSDFIKIPSDKSEKIWCLFYNDIIRSYVVRRKEQIQPLENYLIFKKLSKDDKGKQIVRRNPKIRLYVIEGVVKEINKEKKYIVVNVPEIKHKKYNKKFKGEWKFSLPEWFLKPEDELAISIDTLRVNDTVRVISLPGETTNRRERELYEIKLIDDKPMEFIDKLFEVTEQSKVENGNK